MKTENEVKNTPEDEKAVYSQNIPLPVHLKGDAIVEFALMHKYESISVLRLSKYAHPEFAQWTPNKNYVHLWTYWKSTVWLRMITLSRDTQQLALYLTRHNTWQEKRSSVSSVSSITLRHTTVCRWTKDRWKGFHSILPAEFCLHKAGTSP